MKYGIPVPDAVVIPDTVWRDVLIKHFFPVRRSVVVVGCLNCPQGVLRPPPFRIDNACISLVRELPPFGTVHGVIPAHDCADAGVSRFSQMAHKTVDVSGGASGGRVSAVQKCVNNNLPVPECRPCLSEETEKVVLVGVDAFILNQAHEVQPRIIVAPIPDQILPFLVFEGLSGGERIVDSLQFLDDYPPGAHIQMPHFA